MNKISIIVPVYRVETYLNRCLESIVNQTYENVEIILVDDGSPDKCPIICDDWAKRDGRIKVVHQTNVGLSGARNVGIKIATGDYIAFVDSDDYIAPEMFKTLLERMISTNSDIVCCDAMRIWEDSTAGEKMVKNTGDYILNSSQAMDALIQGTCMLQTVWNKLYKASLVKGVLFKEGVIHEDEYWSWQIVGSANRIATVKNAYYYYTQRKNSIMGNGYTGYPMLIIDAKLQRHAFIKEKFPELLDIDCENIINTCFYIGVQVLKNEPKEKQEKYMDELKRAVSVCRLSNSYMKGKNWHKQIRLHLIQRYIKFACILGKLHGVE